MLNLKTIISNSVSEEQETEHQQKIQKWLEDINKVKYCDNLVDVVSQCENLKIAFDFESDQINKHPLSDLQPDERNITIGTKLSSTRTEQEVKGLLARELCRYAIYLTYENVSFPYYKNDITAAQNYNKIIESISNLTSNATSKHDKIIASVIQTSSPDTILTDLIATAIQILVQFDDEKEEVTRFEVKFKILFDYFENFILPEMKNLNLKFRENVRKFNRTADVLPSVLGLELELSELKDVKSLTENNFSIIQTNFPKLLLLNIQKCLKIDHGSLFDFKNIFVSSESLKSQELHDLLAQDQNLNVFVNFCGKIDENLKNFFACKTSKFTFIVSDKNQCQELTQQLTESGLVPSKAEVNYSWNDLTLDSKKFLLKMKINFQNNSEFSFFDILKDKFNPEDEEVVRNFTNVVDDQLLGLMIEGSDIRINAELKVEKNIKFDLKERSFVKIELKKDNEHLSPPDFKPKFFYENITKCELLKDIQDEKFVIISDKPGSGKTSEFKNFVKEFRKEHPTDWITYIDLKQYSEQFKDQMLRRRDPDFPSFFAETILKSKTQFEVKIFKKMYDLGKVFIFLDGLDELTPSCTDFILKQLKDFDSNEGSQLWIATCESMEFDLQKVLEYDVKFRFEEFSEDICVELIAENLMQIDAENSALNVHGGKDVNKKENFESLKQIAKDLWNEKHANKYMSIGLPQLCKMIAEISKNDGTCSIDSTELTIFRNFAQNIHKKWSVLQSSEAQSKNLDFWTLHQFMAIKSSFPNYVDFCDANFENFEFWSDEDILAGGLITKIGENFVFLHSTYCDFFVAEFILKILKQEEVPSWFIQFLMKILTTRRYKCIRMFLNQGLNDGSELKLSDKTIKSITANIDEFTNISFIFTENVESLQQFLIMFLNRRRYKIVKSILVSNIDAIFATVKNSENSINIQNLLDFLVKFLNSKCLESLIKEKKMFFKIVDSCDDIDHLASFANAIKQKVGSTFAVQNFKGHRRSKHPNIFFTFCWSKNVDKEKIQKFFKILKGFMNVRRIMELMKTKSRWNSKSIFSESVRIDPAAFKVLWTEIEDFYKSNESHRKFKELIMHGVEQHRSVLQTIGYVNNIELHDYFWDLAVNTFGHEELMNFIKTKDTSFTDYFLGAQMSYPDSPKFIEFTFEKLQKIFNAEQFHNIIESKTTSGGNLLKKATEASQNIKILKSVWNFMKNFCKSDEKFLELLREVDSNGSNILSAAIQSSRLETLEFIIHQLKINMTTDDIKSLASVVDNNKQNIFYNIYGVKIFSTAWNLITEYLNSSGILEIIQNRDNSDTNFILRTFQYEWFFDKIICDEMWKEVKLFINNNEIMSADVLDNIENCGKIVDNFEEHRFHQNCLKILEFKWLRTKTLRLLDNPETLKIEISNSELFSCAYDFYVLANCEDFEIHEICWEFILKKYENRQDLVQLMTKRSVHGSIFIHSIMSNKNIEIIKFILKMLQDIFDETQIRTILTVKTADNLNLLASAGKDSKSIEIVNILWQMYESTFTSSELIDLLTLTSESTFSNLWHAARSSAEIFTLILKELTKLLNPENDEKCEKIIKLTMQRNYSRETILHVCVEQHDVELLKVVWNEVKTILGGSLRPTVKLCEWNENKYYDWYNDIQNLLEKALKSEKIEFHEALWELLWETFNEDDELRSLMLYKKDKPDGKIEDEEETSGSDEDDAQSVYSENSQCQRICKRIENNDEPYDGNEFTNKTSILYFLIEGFKNKNLEVIKLTMENLEKILTKNEIMKILISTEYDSFLENESDSIDKHQLLWDIYRKYLTVADLKNFAHKFFSKALCKSATISVEIFKFVWNEVKKEAESSLIPALEAESNIISACVEHKDKDLLKVVWTEVENFYKIQNLPESFKEYVMKWNYFDNIFNVAAKVDDVEIHETLWKLILSTFSDHEELKNILVRCLENEGSLIAEIFGCKNVKVVEFLVKTMQESFTQSQLQELMRADLKIFQNLMNLEENKFEIFKIWWQFIKVIFPTSDKFVEFIEINDNFHAIFGHANSETLELFFNDLKLLMTRDQIRKNLLKVKKTIDHDKIENIQNILHIALYRGNECGSDYQFAWQYIHEYLERQEIYNLLAQLDGNKRNFLFFIVTSFRREILEITWNEVRKALSREDQIKFLKSKHSVYGNLFSYYVYDRDEIESWFEKTCREYKIRINKSTNKP